MCAAAKKIDFLTTGVGRGHRFYLEGLRSALLERAPELCGPVVVARAVSGVTAQLIWTLAEGLYRHGSRGGSLGAAYSRLRQRGKLVEEGFAIGRLRSDLLKWAGRSPGPLVVDHPLLAVTLAPIADRRPLVYMHGELVAPGESLTTAPSLTLAPTADVADAFQRAGAEHNATTVTGLCVERSLIALADSARKVRLERLQRGEPLHGVYYSSGAEPTPHCRALARAAAAALEAGGRATVFAKEDGRLHALLERERSLAVAPGLTVVRFRGIADEEHQLAARFSDFDYFVAPAHERTNWAVGLGLPFFWLEPNFGSFAPLNAQLAAAAVGARPIGSVGEADDFGEVLGALREAGVLSEMNAPVREDIRGFECAAEVVRSLT
ncbi:MAG TPA: hypothetical protein VLB27_07000 [candidate division Zixibacteria bacterium]|nr:hypothetical protein [candidate division Zixibacteria bacterium]